MYEEVTTLSENGQPGDDRHHGIDHTIDQVTGKVADLGRDIGEYIKQQRSSAKISLRQLSKLAGVSNPYLSQIERGLRKPSAEILQQIAKGLRISAEALYVRAGILDVAHGGPVVDAVRADDALTERQKQILLDVYESFRRENAGSGAEATERPSRTVPDLAGDSLAGGGVGEPARRELSSPSGLTTAHRRAGAEHGRKEDGGLAQSRERPNNTATTRSTAEGSDVDGAVKPTGPGSEE